MWTYVSTDETSAALQHYGVLGMKWGVHRARRALSRATAKEEATRAISSLNTHRSKAGEKLSKYKAKDTKLQKKVDKFSTNKDVKAAKYNYKSAKNKRKSQ